MLRNVSGIAQPRLGVDITESVVHRLAYLIRVLVVTINSTTVIIRGDTLEVGALNLTMVVAMVVGASGVIREVEPLILTMVVAMVVGDTREEEIEDIMGEVTCMEEELVVMSLIVSMVVLGIRDMLAMNNSNKALVVQSTTRVLLLVVIISRQVARGHHYHQLASQLQVRQVQLMNSNRFFRV